jgi:hypothetical protein
MQAGEGGGLACAARVLQARAAYGCVVNVLSLPCNACLLRLVVASIAGALACFNLHVLLNQPLHILMLGDSCGDNRGAPGL